MNKGPIHGGRLVAGLALVVAVAGLSSCTFISSILGLGQDKSPAAVVYAISGYVSGVRSLLAAKNLPGLDSGLLAAIAAKAEQVAKGVAAASGFAAGELAGLIPPALGGAISSLGNSLLDDGKKTAIVRAVTGAFVANLKGKFAATRGFRALAADSLVLDNILSGIAVEAVRNLPAAGFSADAGRTAAAGGVAGGMLEELGAGGVDKSLLAGTVSLIAEKTIGSLEEAGLADAAAVAAALRSVTSEVLASLSLVTVSGFSASDYPLFAAAVARGASLGLDNLATGAAPVPPADLASAFASGAAQGLATLVASDASLPAATRQALVEETASAATAGLMAATFATSGGTPDLSLFSAATAAFSKTLITDGTITRSEVVSLVTQGAAAAAQTLANPLDAAVLATAIVLSDASGASIAPPTADITQGIAIGTNNPPTATASAVVSVTVGDSVTLSGMGSDLDSGDVLGYLWSIASAPSGSLAVIDPATAASASSGFVPDLAGSYLISFKVSDGKATAEAFCTVTASPAANPVTGIILNSDTLSLVTGDATLGSAQLTFTIQPSNATVKTAKWSSSDDTIATVTAGGLVTATLASGGAQTAYVTATSDDGSFTASCAVTVNSPSLPAAFLTGVVRDSKTSLPIRGALVHLGGDTSWTDVNGVYNIQLMQAGPQNLDWGVSGGLNNQDGNVYNGVIAIGEPIDTSSATNIVIGAAIDRVDPGTYTGKTIVGRIYTDASKTTEIATPSNLKIYVLSNGFSESANPAYTVGTGYSISPIITGTACILIAEIDNGASRAIATGVDLSVASPVVDFGIGAPASVSWSGGTMGLNLNATVDTPQGQYRLPGIVMAGTSGTFPIFPTGYPVIWDIGGSTADVPAAGTSVSHVRYSPAIAWGDPVVLPTLSANPFTGVTSGLASYSTSTGTLSLGAAPGGSSYYVILKQVGLPSFTLATSSASFVLPDWVSGPVAPGPLYGRFADVSFMAISASPPLGAAGLARANQSIPDFEMAYEYSTSAGMLYTTTGVPF